MPKNSLRVVAVTACVLTFVLTSCNVAPTSSTSTTGHSSVVTSACTSQPASGPWTGSYRLYADSTRTHFCYQDISKFGVLDVYPTSGSPQIGPTSGSKQTISNAIGRDVAASLVHLPRGTEIFRWRRAGAARGGVCVRARAAAHGAVRTPYAARLFGRPCLPPRGGNVSLPRDQRRCCRPRALPGRRRARRRLTGPFRSSAGRAAVRNGTGCT